MIDPTTPMMDPGVPSTSSFGPLGISRTAPTGPSPGVSIGGILQIRSAADLREIDRQRVAESQNQPVIINLAAHVRRCWYQARIAREMDYEWRMFKSIRQRRGEYDPEKLAQIRQQGGTEIYMMLTSAKCRGASAWLRDVMMAQGSEKPWAIKPTPIPSLPPELVQELRQEATKQLMEYMQATGQQPGDLALRQFLMDLREEYINQMYEEAKQGVEQMEKKMEDQLVEGGFLEAIDAFIDDLVTYPVAILKGPVVRRRSLMNWTMGPDGAPALTVTDTLRPEWERVDPFMAYPSPAAVGVNDGYFIERHRMRQVDLEALIGVEGYDEATIRQVLDEYARGGLHEWIIMDSQKAQAEGRTSIAALNNSEALIDALQFWGNVPGKMLLEWGLTEQDIPEPTKQYPCEVWLIANYVIKASLNYHPLGERPYFKASYEEIPGVFWGNSIPDLIRDCQDVCNSAARALVNNMGISSGPQCAVLSDRMPPGEDVTAMYPWKIWQFNSDPFSGSAAAKPIEFFMPDSQAQVLMQVYEKFAVLADEYCNIPRYMTGDAPAGGAGRTASGMSMLMNNATKAMQQVVSNIDAMMRALLERLYFHNMKYGEDPATQRTDIQIVAQGAAGVIAKEQAQVRRNEFMAATANPFDMAIMGTDGRAALLRERAQDLDMDPDDIVPPKARITLLQKMQQAGALGPPAGAPQPGVGTSPPGGTPPSPGGPSPSGQNLQNGAPVTDLRSPVDT